MNRLSILVGIAFLWTALTAQDQSIRKIDTTIEQARAAWDVPGLAVAIVRNDSVLLAKGYGFREMNKPEQVDENTLFAIASNTKAFTAALMAILVDEHKVSWDDHVQTYLPYFQLYDPYVSADVRIEDLLSHRVGLRTFSGDLIWYGTPYSREEVVRRARFLPQAYPFRAGYGYSNIMYIAAGEVIEHVTGTTWESFLTERILKPIGMTHTVLSVGALASEHDVATPHGEVDGKLTTFPWYPWPSTVPAGGIITSASDISKWMRLVLNRGTWNGKQIYSDVQSRVMWTPHNNFVVSQRGREQNPYTNFSGYGLGWSLMDYHGDLVVSHGGGYDGMFSQTVLVPDKKLGVVVLTNSMTGISGAIALTVIDRLLGVSGPDRIADGLKRTLDGKKRRQEREAREASMHVTGTRPSFALDHYTGTYGGPMYGDATITLQDGHLVLRLLPNPDFVADVSHWQYDVFELTWRKNFPWFGKGKIQFLMDENGNVTEFKLNVPNNDFWFDELQFKRKSEENK